MNKVKYVFATTLIPSISLAHEVSSKSVWEKLVVATFPVLVIVAVFWLFMLAFNKGSKNINERLLESNQEIAKELKRIADHVENDS